MRKLLLSSLVLVSACMIASETNLIELSSKAAFDQALKDHAVVVVDFHATWCGPCRQQGPILHTVAEKYSTVYFIKVNIENFGSLAQEYNVANIPTLLFFKNGTVQKRTVGVQKAPQLQSILDSLLK